MILEPTRTVVIPTALDPMRDPHGIAIAQALSRSREIEQAPPRLNYVFIVFTNRSGSNYLGELIETTGFFNLPREILNCDNVIAVSRARRLRSFPHFFFTSAAELSKNGTFVVKAGIGQVAVLAAYGILGAISGQSHFVVVERMDKLGQAISWQIATQTGRFTSLQTPEGRPSPVYDRELIRSDLDRLTQSHAAAGLFMALNGIVPLHLTYEFIVDRPALATTLFGDFVGKADLPSCPAAVRLQRQATATNDAWREKFLAGA